MAKSSFISNFKKVPLGFLLALLVIGVLERSIFSNAWLLANRSTVEIMHKKRFLRSIHEPDIIFLGDSRIRGIDMKNLEKVVSTPDSLSFYNYAISYWGVDMQYYLILKQYLKYKRQPQLLFVSLGPEFFYAREEPGPHDIITNNSFRRFMDFGILAVGVFDLNSYSFGTSGPGLFRSFADITRSLTSLSRLLEGYISNSIPSYDFRVFIRNYGPDYLVFSENQNQDLKNVSDRRSIAEVLKSNRQALQYLSQHKGQNMNDWSAEVEPGSIMESMPQETSFKRNYGLEQLVQLTHERGITTVFFFMPYWRDRYRLLSEKNPGYFKNVVRYLRYLEEKYPNFIVSSEELPIYEMEYFGDWSHLNKRGVNRFNEEFLPRFKRILESKRMLPLAVEKG